MADMTQFESLLKNQDYLNLSNDDKAYARLGWFKSNIQNTPEFDGLDEEDQTAALKGLRSTRRG